MEERRDKSVLVIGGGGHGKSVIAILQACGWTVEAAFDDDPAARGQSLLGVRVVGPTSELAGEQSMLAIIAVADGSTKKSIAQRLDHLNWATLVDDRAYRNPTADIGEGNVVFPFSVVGADTQVGVHSLLSAHTTVGHDATIGEYVHLAPGVQVCGEAHVGSGSLLGAGTVVTPGVRVGEWCKIGAGSVVVKDLPDGCRAMGCPARPV